MIQFAKHPVWSEGWYQLGYDFGMFWHLFVGVTAPNEESGFINPELALLGWDPSNSLSGDIPYMTGL